MARRSALLIAAALTLAGCAAGGGAAAGNLAAGSGEPIVFEHGGGVVRAIPEGWRHADTLPGNEVEDAQTRARRPASPYTHIRASVDRVEPWYGRVLERDEGETTYGADDWVAVPPDDPRVELDSYRVFTVYLDVQHQFGGTVELPEFFVLDGGTFPPGEDFVAAFEALDDAVFYVNPDPWYLDPSGRPDDRPLFPRFGPGAAIYPVGGDGTIDHPEFSNVHDLERRAQEPDQIIVVEELVGGRSRVVERRPKQ